MLNPDTLVAVCGYSGDASQVKALLPYILHHQCPVLILSPEDAPITPAALGLRGHPQLLFREAGKRAYIGPDSLERQKQHMRVMLEHPFKHILMHDSDSLCLSPKLPRYLYDEDVFWSNEASDHMHTMPEGYAFPRYAAQPPYFCSRRSLQAHYEACARLPFDDMKLQFIDHYLMRLSAEAKEPHKTFPNGVSCPTRDHPPGVAHMLDRIAHGGIMLHAIKTREVILTAANGRLSYLRAHPEARG